MKERLLRRKLFYIQSTSCDLQASTPLPSPRSSSPPVQASKIHSPVSRPLPKTGAHSLEVIPASSPDLVANRGKRKARGSQDSK